MLKWTVRTQKETIANERERLENLVYERTVLKTHDGFLADWIPKWLSKSDEEHLKTDVCKKHCRNCGKKVDKWIETEFSFCDEYGCGITFCETCAKELAKKFNNL